MTRARNRRRSAAALPMALARAAVARPRCEPVEIEDPTNVALDDIEARVRDVLRAGGEVALVARLARLLPGFEVVNGGSMLGVPSSSAVGSGSVSPPPTALVQNAAEGDRHG